MSIDSPDRSAALTGIAIALGLEHSWNVAAKLTNSEGRWYDGACVEVSIQLRDELEVKAPDIEPVFIWGQFSAGRTKRALRDHAWVEIKGDIILDMTGGQFFTDGDAFRLVLPIDRLAERYEEVERDPDWARS